MLTAAAVLVCVLEMVGRPMPPIVLLSDRPRDASPNAEAFVRRNPDTIYLLTQTDVFYEARRGNYRALRKLASILVHEEWHLRHSADERGAYEAQLYELLRLGESPDQPLYRGVMLAMRSVLRDKL